MPRSPESEDTPPHPRAARRRAPVVAAIAVGLCGVLATIVVLVAPRVRHGPQVERPAWIAGLREGRVRSEYCVTCHAEIGDAWRRSDHHRANRDIAMADTTAMFADQTVATHASTYRLARGDGGQPQVEETRRDGTRHVHVPAMVLANDPLQQLVIETDPGRLQVSEIAWDPHAREWFPVFGDEERNPGEWGHWTGQGMNWNSMCARCHMTGYDKGYDETTNRFHSAWVEHGIGCVQCHGPMTGHEKAAGTSAGSEPVRPDPRQWMETCAACHARAEELTPTAPPAANFEDHFRLQLMTDPQVYHPDGQILAESFEYGSFRHSRMFAAGVTCLDCHDPHSGRTTLPVDDNSLCLQCHVPGNPRGAPAIDPTAHSFHTAGSKGNRCVECHMATTTYMQRDPRRDHGFIIPDPVLTRDVGVPNACSRCHQDQSLAETITAWERWYGDGSSRTTANRARTRAVARAFAGDVDVVPELVRLIAAPETTPTWRASLLDLAGQLAPRDSAVLAAARDLRQDPDAEVRAAAVRMLGADPDSGPLVRQALEDPVRLVRLDAAWALGTELAEDSAAGRELRAYLNTSVEGPVALARRGSFRFEQGEHERGLADVRRAIGLDPRSAPLRETLAFMLNAAGRPREAAEAFARAAELAPDSAAPAFHAALAWVEAGELVRAEAMLRMAVQRDPHHARAWYNLGLLLNRFGRRDEALTALATGEAARPDDPDIPYAAATILAQAGRRDEALAAARRALAADPDHAEARALVQMLERE